jgi:hypothetical protein
MAIVKNQKTNIFKEEEKGCIVKSILIVLLFALSICSAQTDKKSTKPPCSKIDVPKADCCDLAEKQNEIKKSIDSIAIKAAKESLEFYDKSFKEMLASYNCFVWIMVGGTILIIIVGTIIFIIVLKIGLQVKKRSNKIIEPIKQLPETLLAVAEAMLPRFEKAAPNSNIKLGELKPGNYVHVLRGNKPIGCFCKKNGNLVFECHNSYENPKEKIQLSDLTDEKIKYILENTPRKGA